MSDEQKRIYEALENLSSDKVLELFLNFYGTQILSGEFGEFVGDELNIEI